MKAYKCPKCGDLNHNKFCPDCNYTSFDAKQVEIIDWEKELKTEENGKD